MENIVDKLKSVSLDPRNIPSTDDKYQTASQILWSTGMLNEPIPNGFYSIIPEKRLKELYENIPSLDELQSMELEIILVDAEKDKKLSMLKQLISTLAKGVRSNPATMIKKIAGSVSDFYKRSSESPSKAGLDETSHKGVQLVGQIKHGSCRSRAILFKVLADTVGLESKLIVGLPSEGGSEYADSNKHMSVLVELNSVELLVDLMRFPGQLIPLSSKAIFMTHIPAGESDSAENDSCDSPLEPNSPLFGESSEKDDGTLYQRRLEASLNTAGPSLRNMMLRSSTFNDRKISLSHSEPDIATTFWRRSRRKVITEARTASSSPEHPSFRVRGRSTLSNDLSADVTSTRSEGSSTTSETRRRRRSMSITPEISDDIVRAVRAINESAKQNRLLRSLPSSPQYKVVDETVSTWNKVLESPMFHNKSLLPYEEWSIDFSELTVGTRVGIGFFGEVFRGIWNGTDVAIKVFLEQDLTAENMQDFCNEISILSRLRHPNVILFLGACTKPPRLSMVTEYMEMGSLYYLIHLSGQKKKLSWRRRLKMLRDICRGLMCLHRMKIVHRDLKSANCLVNKHWTVKICDFGLSRIMTESSSNDTSSAGTPEWMAPELIRNEPFTDKCDIFSLGVIIWELCTLRRPWEGVPPERVVYSVANEGSRLEIPEGPLGSIITDCWKEANERPSCEEIIKRLLECEDQLC